MGRALAIVLAAAALLAPPAHAGTASITSHFVTEGGKGGDFTFEAITVHYAASPGETNDVTVSTSGNTLTLTDTAGVTAGEGCMAQPSPLPTVVCRFSQGNGDTGENTLEVTLADGDDRFAFGAREYALGLHVDGGTGNDVLTGSVWSEQLEGGPGDDMLDTGPAGDAPTLDLLTGGEGADTFRVRAPARISYADHTTGVTLDMRDLLHLGSAGENDRIEGGPFDLVGGPGDDAFTGTDARDTFAGGPGDDRIDGAGGDDDLDGGTGADHITGGAGHDLIEGGGGRDDIDGGDGPDSIFESGSGGSGGATIRGGRGDDRIEAGSGSDLIDGGPGHDDLYGGPAGRDTLLARDGEADTVSCTALFDSFRGRAVVDDVDMTGGCARVDRPHSPRPLVTSRPTIRVRAPTHRLSLGIGCPSDFRPRRCRGSLVARHGTQTLARGRFDLAANSDSYARARTRRAILRAPGRFAVHYTLRTADRRGHPVTIEFDRTFTRTR